MENETKRDSRQIIMLIGPPASGKGTVARYFKEARFTVIGTGDILRQEIAKGTPLGLEIAPIMDSGGIVDNQIVTDLVRARLDDPEAEAFVFDGSPRNLDQAKSFDALLEEKGFDPQNIYILMFQVEDDQLLARMEDRRQNMIAAGQEPRADDNPETFKARLDIFKSDATTLIDYFGDRLKFIDGNGSPQNSLKQVLIATGTALPPSTPANVCVKSGDCPAPKH